MDIFFCIEDPLNWWKPRLDYKIPIDSNDLYCNTVFYREKTGKKIRCLFNRDLVKFKLQSAWI